MAVFNTNAFLKVTGQTGGNLGQAVGAAFGFPSCLTQFTSELLGLLPSGILTGMQAANLAGKQAANAATKKILAKLQFQAGIFEFDTDTGTIVLKSISSGDGILGAQGEFLKDLNATVNAFQAVVGFGTQIYQNYQNIEDQVNSIIGCLEKFQTLKKYGAGASMQLQATTSLLDDDEQLAVAAANLKDAQKFIEDSNKLDANISAVLAARAADPSLEPKFVDTEEVKKLLGDSSFETVSPIDPGLGQEETFRLVFGPPKSVDGQYLLSVDGLYYDAQSGGLDPVMLSIKNTVAPGDAWKLDYDANIGGKGQAVSLANLNAYVDNIFDPDIIDDSKGLTEYYKNDTFLQVLIEEKAKHISDLNKELDEFTTTYGVDSAIVSNFKQSIVSEISAHDGKVNKRKKQIEVAIKAPQIYGAGPIFFSDSTIPINDFSYLQDLNLGVDLEKQKSLVFEQGSVQGVVLPITPKFVKSPTQVESLKANHLIVPKVGTGDIVYSASGATDGTIHSLTDEIETEDLFAVYNFLNSKVALPSSLDYESTNAAVPNTYNNAQILAANPSKVYASGLGIPYFGGIVENNKSDTAAASAMGSFARLPDSSEFRNLTYNPSGFTIDFWTHVPNIMDGEEGWLSSTASSLTKCVLACENVGAKSGIEQLDAYGDLADLDYLSNNKGDSFVRGMVMGFTRDRRITQDGVGYSNNNEDNNPASSLSFFIAPTISRDASSASWINKDACLNVPDFFKMRVNLAGTPIGSVSSSFVHLAISVSPQDDEISMYCDGTLLTTSSVTEVFGNTTPSLPSFKKENSFEYSSTTVDGPDTVKQGPSLNPFFTPWIVGGGYTDGNYYQGNFMGGDRGGITSGLRGYLGSLKFYSRPLDNTEVLNNYTAQKGFFKNILI